MFSLSAAYSCYFSSFPFYIKNQTLSSFRFILIKVWCSDAIGSFWSGWTITFHMQHWLLIWDTWASGKAFSYLNPYCQLTSLCSPPILITFYDTFNLVLYWHHWLSHTVLEIWILTLTLVLNFQKTHTWCVCRFVVAFESCHNMCITSLLSFLLIELRMKQFYYSGICKECLILMITSVFPTELFSHVGSPVISSSIQSLTSINDFKTNMNLALHIHCHSLIYCHALLICTTSTVYGCVDFDSGYCRSMGRILQRS